MVSSSIDPTRPVTMADVETAMIDLLTRDDSVMAQAARHHLGSGGGRARAAERSRSSRAARIVANGTACVTVRAGPLSGTYSIVSAPSRASPPGDAAPTAGSATHVSHATVHQPPPCEAASECMLTARLSSTP